MLSIFKVDNQYVTNLKRRFARPTNRPVTINELSPSKLNFSKYRPDRVLFWYRFLHGRYFLHCYYIEAFFLMQRKCID